MTSTNSPIDYQRVVEDIRNAFQSLDMNRILACFTDDIEVHYNDLPLMQGKESLKYFLSDRYRDMKNYQLSKRLRLIQDNELTVEVDAQFFKQGQVFRSRILEILTMQDKKIARWEYVGVQSVS